MALTSASVPQISNLLSIEGRCGGKLLPKPLGELLQLYSHVCNLLATDHGENQIDPSFGLHVPNNSWYT